MLLPETIEALRFLALSQGDMIKYLPSDALDLCYVMPDSGDEILFAAEAIVRSVAKAIDLGICTTNSKDLKLLLLELRCVVTVMLDLGNIVISYHWRVAKSKYSATGPYDDIWLVLKRYAILSLQNAGLELVPPTWTFTHFLNFAEFDRTIRPNPDRD